MNSFKNGLVVVTGAGGFVGGATARAFKLDGFRVVGTGNGSPPTDGDHAVCHAWHEGSVCLQGFEDIVRQHGRPSIVVHAAGGSSVQAALNAPLADFNRTVVATAELVEGLRTLAPEAHLLMISSAAIYGNGHAAPIPETTIPAPISHYGAHKLMAEQLCLAGASHWGLQVDIVRFFSIYGAGLRKQIFWDLHAQLEDNPSEIVLGGTGAETRDFLHISDAARILMLLAAAPPIGTPRIVNGGSGRAVSIRQAAEFLAKSTGSEAEIRFDGRPRPDNPDHLIADTGKAEEMGFVARTALQNGLNDYVAWCRGPARLKQNDV